MSLLRLASIASLGGRMYFPIEDDEYGTATLAFLICSSSNKETFTATRDIAANVRNVVFKPVGALNMYLVSTDTSSSTQSSLLLLFKEKSERIF